MENTSSGEKDQADMEIQNDQNMAASSANSPKKGRPHTSKISKLTREEVLEILTQSFHMAEEAGFILDVKESEGAVIVSLHSVTLKNGVLIPTVTVKA